MYDERTYALRDFKLNPTDDFYPRLGYLSVGDKFTTNCACAEVGEEEVTVAEAWSTAKTNFEKNEIYGVACELGYIQLVDAIPADGPVLRAIEITTMPDGQNAIKFEVIRA